MKVFLATIFSASILAINCPVFGQEVSTSQIDSLNDIASHLLIHKNNSDSAYIVASYTLKKSADLNYDYGRARALVLIGSYYVNKAQINKAKANLKKADSIYISNHIFGDSVNSRYGILLQSMGTLYIYERDFDKSAYYSKLAGGLFEQEGDSSRLQNTLNNLGIINGRQGRYADAVDYFLKAYEMANNMGNGMRASTIMGNISLCYKYMGHYDKALEYLKEGLKVDVENDWRSQTNKFNSIGEIYKELDQIDSSIYYRNKAFESAKRFEQFNSAIIALSSLSGLYFENEDIGKAEALMEQALELADSAGIKDVQEKFDMVKAAVFLHNDQPDSSIFYGLKALNTTSKFSNFEFASHLSDILSQAYQKKNRFDSALYYFKLHKSFEDSLFNKKGQRKFTELYAKLDNLEKESEIKFLNKQNELERYKKNQATIIFTSLITSIVLLVALLIYRHRNKMKKKELEEVKLKSQVKKAEEDVYKQTLHMIHINNCLNDVEEEVRNAMAKNPDSIYRKVLQTIKINKSLNKDWENFNNYFSKVNSDFYIKLNSLDKALSEHEQRVCALIKLNLNTHEIATILNIEPKSVTMIKYRIKKKVDLSGEEDLGEFIRLL